MFSGCIWFNSNLSAWNVSNVRNMDHVFMYCRDLNTDFSTWDTSNVSNMDGMFYCITEFKGNTIYNLNTSQCTTMADMFKHCRNFNGDVSAWNTGNVSNMEGMFALCHKFNGDLSRWDTSQCTNMHYMFAECFNFNCNLSHWDMSNVSNVINMFTHCKSFMGGITHWDLSNVRVVNAMMRGCLEFNEESIHWDLRNVKNVDYLFGECLSFNADVQSIKVPSDLEDLNMTFWKCPAFEGNGLEKWQIKTPLIRNTAFRKCTNINLNKPLPWKHSNTALVCAEDIPHSNDISRFMFSELGYYYIPLNIRNQPYIKFE